MSLVTTKSYTPVDVLKPKFPITSNGPLWGQTGRFMPNLDIPFAGIVVARFTSGANSGKMTFFSAAGADGQQNALGFLMFALKTDANGDIIRTYGEYGQHEVLHDSVSYYKSAAEFYPEDIKIWSGTAVLPNTGGNIAIYNAMFGALGKNLDGTFIQT